MGSANFEATVDVNDGCTFQIPANFIRVVAEYLDTPPWRAFPPTFHPPVRLNGAFAYGGVPQMCSPARYTDKQFILSGNTATYEIPPFAKSFTLVTSDPVGTADIVVGVPFSPYATYSLVAPHSNADTQVENQFPIPNSSNLLTVTNTGPNDAVFSVIYTLGF
jgi:hypothetical protein